MATADLPAPPRPSRAAAPHWRGGDNLGRAVMFIVVAALLLPMLNAGAKYLADRYPVIEITFARYAGHFLYMIVAFAPVHGRSLMKSSMPGVQIFRSSLLCASTLLFIAGLRYLTLPTATAIAFTAPIIVTALSPLMLREHVGPWRWGAVAAGFIGALVIVRPGAASENWAGLLTLAGAACAAFYQIVSRRFAGRDSVATSITYMALVGFLMTAIPLPFIWQTPTTIWDVLVFLSLGLFGGFGHYFMVRAFELAPAPFIAPFNYVQLVFATGLAYLFFGHLPDAWTWGGAAIIVASGIFILHRETVVVGSSPQHGDVVAFRLPRDDSVDYLQRVVGLPGDRIQMVEGALNINGAPVKREPLDDFVSTDYRGRPVRLKRWRETLPNGVSHETLDADPNGFLDNTPVFEVPPGHYFVMGDNRDNSNDSRVPATRSGVGFVPAANLVGRARLVYISFDREAEGRAPLRAERTLKRIQ